MDRRLIGALLVVAVVAAATVVPALHGLRIAGEAIAIELPADPRFGDCLLTKWSGFGLLPGAAPAGAVTTSAPSTAAPGSAKAEPSPVFGSCGGKGQVAGEVLAVVSAAGDEAARRAQVRATGPNCQQLAFAYAGLIPTDKNHYGLPGWPAEPVSWSLSVNLQNAWILPDPLLRAAGRTWAACVAAPARSDFYHGRLFAAYAGGKLPDGFGSCWDQRSVNVAMRPINCGDPHQSELISLGTVPNLKDITRAAIEGSCLRLAGRIMGRADPTANGGLEIQVDPQDDIPRAGARLNVVCYIVPTKHSLAGTLVGLGDRPVPYSH